MKKGLPVKLSVIVPTVDRYEILKESLPLLLKQDFYEIIVVDSSGTIDAHRNRELCQRLGAKYYHKVGNREVARNFGANKAEGDWIYIFDDDVKLLNFDAKTFEEIASKDFDFIHSIGHLVWLFRKNFFRKIGGYNTKLCYGDDYDITYRAHKHGKGAHVSRLGKFGTPIKGKLKMRWKGIFYYGLTIFTLFKKYPSLKRALSIPHRVVFYWKKFMWKRTKEALVRFALTLIGVLLSPLYHLKVEFLVKDENKKL